MVKHTPIIRQRQSTNCWSVFDHFVGLGLKVLNELINRILIIRRERIIKHTRFKPYNHVAASFDFDTLPKLNNQLNCKILSFQGSSLFPE